MTDELIRYSVSSKGYGMRRYLDVNFECSTSTASTTLWEELEGNSGATIVARGRFNDPSLCKDVLLAVDAMNLTGRFFPGLIEKRISAGSIFSEKAESR